MSRVINFNAGPSALPLEVLEQTQKEMLDYAGSGMSILEHSHRGKVYEEVHRHTKTLISDLLRLDDDVEILFMTGGASTQFALVPMNLLTTERPSADYIVTGTWGEKALSEAKLVGSARTCASSEGVKYTRLPDAYDFDAQAAYVHITSNNTIYGTQFTDFPDTGAVPLVADMSSDFLSRRLDTKRFGLIYAGAQKNLGPAGVTVVIVKKALLERENKTLPKIFRYQTFAKDDSLQNTPPVFAIYMMGHALEWLGKQGGLKGIEVRNEKKADLLYSTIDGSNGFFTCPVEVSARSKMNVVFKLPSEDLEKKFLAEAASAQMVGLKGHRSVGGMRASIYNAVSLDHVERLCEFMRTFAQKRA